MRAGFKERTKGKTATVATMAKTTARAKVKGRHWEEPAAAAAIITRGVQAFNFRKDEAACEHDCRMGKYQNWQKARKNDQPDPKPAPMQDNINGNSHKQHVIPSNTTLPLPAVAAAAIGCWPLCAPPPSACLHCWHPYIAIVIICRPQQQPVAGTSMTAFSVKISAGKGKPCHSGWDPQQVAATWQHSFCKLSATLHNVHTCLCSLAGSCR